MIKYLIEERNGLIHSIQGWYEAGFVNYGNVWEPISDQWHNTVAEAMNAYYARINHATESQDHIHLEGGGEENTVRQLRPNEGASTEES